MRSRHMTRILACLVLLVSLAGAAFAQERYDDPQGRFSTPVPSDWTVSATPDVLTMERAEPAGVLHVLAPVGAEADVVAAALAILVDPGLDAAFASAPLQATPVALPSGVWTQRIYQIGDDIVATISLERGGYTVLVLAQATQPAFIAAVNGAVNQVLLGLEVRIPDPDADADDPQDLPYEVIETSIDAGAHTLAGTLTLPPGDDTVPAIVLVSGSGAQDRDGVNPSMPGYAPLRWLADHLTRAGIAVLRFDERGIGGSGGDHESATSADLADDVTAALRHLASEERVDAARVGVLGHSEGSVIVGRVAAALPDDVAFMIAMAGPALPYSEIVIAQVRSIATASGASEAEVAEAVELQSTIVGLAIDGDWASLEVLALEIAADQIAALPEAQRAQLGDIEGVVAQQAAATVSAFQSPWLQLFLAYDPSDDLRRITAPTLVLFGELDVQVDLEQNRGPFEAALAAAGNDDVTVVVVPQANHLFQAAGTGNVDEYLALEMAFAPGFMDTISDWLTDRFLP